MIVETRRRWLRFFTCPMFWTALSLTAVYVLLAVFMPVQPFLEFVRIAQATAAIIVVTAFSRDAWDSITRAKPEPADSLIIGIFLQAISIFVSGIWLLMYRLGGRQDWMLNLLGFGFLSGWLSAIASIMHVYPVGVLRAARDGDEVPPARLRAAGIAAAVGVCCILIVLATQPDVHEILDHARTWLW
jgi:hypothetical protein